MGYRLSNYDFYNTLSEAEAYLEPFFPLENIEWLNYSIIRQAYV